MKEIIFATNNPLKVKEVQKEFELMNLNFKIYSLKDVHIDIEVVEDKLTLEENALKKATEVYKEISKRDISVPVFAEDFGFFIEDLRGVAGVKTNRWMEGSDDDRIDAILNMLKESSNRKCYYKSVFVYFDGEKSFAFSGVLDGAVASERRGQNGMAYDVIMELTEGRHKGKTIAQLSLEEKNEISSRIKAFRKMLESGIF